MVFESAHVHVTAEYGVATLWLAFPGAPVNALDAPRLAELDSALAAIERNPFLNALVVRSAKPFGFCAGLHPSVAEVTDRAAFAGRGQRVLSRLAALPFTTVAFIDGPCLGAGFEVQVVVADAGRRGIAAHRIAGGTRLGAARVVGVVGEHRATAALDQPVAPRGDAVAVHRG